MLRRQVAGTVAIAAVTAIAACGAPGPAAPATIEIATAGTAAVAVAATPPRPSAEPARAAATSIAWMTSERDAREKARRLGLPLLVWVRAEWAATALEMERKTWAEPRVVQAAAPFVALRLDVTEAEGDAELLAQRYAVDSMPATILFDASGHKAAVLRGYTDAAALAAALSRAAP
ncbi:MAG: thioredoxin family protein [Minicystis sp.]